MGRGVHQQEFLYFPRAVDKNCIQPKKKRKKTKGKAAQEDGMKTEVG